MKEYDKKRADLSRLSSVEAELISTTEAYADFIAERVLWIRSCQAPQLADWQAAAGGLAWSLNPRNWSEAGRAFTRAAAAHPLRLPLSIAAFLGLLAMRRPARRELRALAEESRKRGCTRLRVTFHALWLTALMALPWPLLIAVVGWSLDSPFNESEFVRALSVALRCVACCLLLIEFLRHLCRNSGLADAHFDWPQPCLAQLHRKLRWFTACGLPLVLWAVGLEVQQTGPQWSASLGRACFVGAMLLLTLIFQRLLLAKKSPFRQLIIYRTGGWLTPLQVAWRPAVAAIPAVLAALAVAGYYYTAQQASLRLLQTVALALSVLVLGGVTRRWLLVSRRRLSREQAKQRRAAQLAAAADGDAAMSTAAELVDEAVDVAALSEQTQKLLHAFLGITATFGFFWIWAEILPALSYLGNAPLIPGAVAADNYVPLTWVQLFSVLLVLVVTYVSVRDIPALLELVVLQHLPLDSGFRYAFTSLSRYVLMAVGVSVAFKLMGGQWEKIQWLVAAMSVGLGFGLQEIFANFVSGVILLFERPIRVGDIVTLGDKTGVVNRIRMRATTIVDWDRKEYIVPNKDLITERLLNWTLSDHTNRIEIIVNVASTTDTDLACSLLLEAAREQPHILAEPSPVAMFEGFSETGLKLALRCFLPNLENRGTTIHSLHTAIDRKFRAAGVESAYGDMRIRVARDGSQRADAPVGKADGNRRKTAVDRQDAA
jgi:potassium efflux system protein